MANSNIKLVRSLEQESNPATPHDPTAEIEAAVAKATQEVVLPSTTTPPPSSNASTPTTLTNFVKFIGTLGRIIQGLGRLIYWLVKSIFLYLRNHPFHAMLTLVLIGCLSLVVVTGTELHDRVILGEISEHTVNKIIRASKYTRDFRPPELSQRGPEEFLRVGAPEWAQREAIRAVLFNARRSGLSIEDQAALLAVVEVESGFNPVAKAPTTSACGLFQFVKATGITFGLKPENCMNPWLNAEAGIRHYLDHYERIVRSQINGLSGPERVFKTFELSYYIHHDGPGVVSSSNEVKATILSGTQFLFRVYDLLKDEQKSKEQAPTFSQLFAKNLWQFTNAISRRFANMTGHPQPDNEQLGSYDAAALAAKIS